MLRLIRLLLGSIIALLNWLTRGRKLRRSDKAQELVEHELKDLAIYQFKL